MIGQTRQLMAFLNASENRSRVKTLSAPTVLTTDSTEARIQVGASVPVLTSQGLAAGDKSGATSLFTSTVTNLDTGIILSVTPRITSTGLVSLTINQEISNEVPPAAGSGIQSPSFTKRSVTTHAVAQDGQTIALGGLISYNYNKTINRIPLLGDIPWLGALFGSTSYNTTETELIVLLTPRIISYSSRRPRCHARASGQVEGLAPRIQEGPIVEPVEPGFRQGEETKNWKLATAQRRNWKLENGNWPRLRVPSFQFPISNFRFSLT